MQSSGLTAALLLSLLLVMSAVTPGSSSSARGRNSGQIFARNRGMAVCKEKAALVNLNTTTHMGADKQEVYDIDFFLTRGATSLKEMKFTITKCREAITTNTCEYLKTLKWTVGLCALMKAEGMFWSNAVNNAEPPMRCPFSRGLMRIRGLRIDTTAVATFLGHLDGNVFVIETRFLDQDRALYVCLQMEYEYVRMTG